MMLEQSNGERSLGYRIIYTLVLSGAVLLLLGILGAVTPSQVAHAQSEMPKDEFERRVRTYILDNPEVIAEALQRLEERERAAQASAAKAVLKARADEVLRDPESPVGGDPEGDVTVVEFFDYNCGYCRQMAPQLATAQASDAKLRVVYKEFPVLGSTSNFAAKAALAAHRQGKYVPFHKALMGGKDTLTEDGVLQIAAGLGLDLERLKKDIDDPSIQATIDRNLALGQALHITGTPAFAIGEQIVPGAVDLKTLQQLIREARDRKDR